MAAAVSWDPWDRETFLAPHECYRRLRDEAPLYRNEVHDFYAVSRLDDVERVLVDRDRFLSGRGGTIELIQNDIPIPPGLFIYEDPPFHPMHRGRLSRVFTPRAVAGVEDQVRDFCVRTLDTLAERRTFDWARELAGEVPMRVIGMLLGIPEADQPMLRDHFEHALHRSGPDVEPFEGMSQASSTFGEYIDWRAEHPADDLMTQLLVAEFQDETGATRRLTREEVLTYLNLLAVAGNDTTARTLGWVGRLLADHPDQRRALAADPAGIPGTVEEVLRYEPPPYAIGRCVAEDVELHGETVPAGAVVICLVGAANRDERHFGPDAGEFDVTRRFDHSVTFGYGPHFCLGANLARLEVRIVLDEVLRRMPDWEVDESGAVMTEGFHSRGWASLPVTVG